MPHDRSTHGSLQQNGSQSCYLIAIAYPITYAILYAIPSQPLISISYIHYIISLYKNLMHKKSKFLNFDSKLPYDSRGGPRFPLS